MPETISHALLVNAGTVLLAMALLWALAVRLQDVSFIDAVWGGGMAALVAFTWVRLGMPGGRGLLIAAMATIWGTRLAVHLLRRWRGHGEDPRYAAILGKAKKAGHWPRAAGLYVFAPQAVLLYVTCLPAQLGVIASAPTVAIPPLAWLGAAIWLVGIVFETVGDAQLAAFRADPASKGKVLDTGLWRYTRHPNYFGDACAWWGIWLAAASCGWLVAGLGAIGPVFLTFTLTKWSGKPLLEKGMARRRPGYADYVARTSGFIPWPPKR